MRGVPFCCFKAKSQLKKETRLLFSSDSSVAPVRKKRYMLQLKVWSQAMHSGSGIFKNLPHKKKKRSSLHVFFFASGNPR